ncbi:MAG TPA: hypothetical protein VF950_17335 [Planctomycetota bacterium]
MVTLVLAALCAQANQADAVVTVKKKASTWSFAALPERRVKREDLEFDDPARLLVAWTITHPKGLSAAQPFLAVSGQDVLTVDFYQPGKRYEDKETAAAMLASGSRDQLLEVAQAMLERYFEFDLDFPGGSWDELAPKIKERLTAAYAQQLPELLKARFPAKIDIEVVTREDVAVRYPALQAKAVTLGQLRDIGFTPALAARQESALQASKDKAGNLQVGLVTESLLGQWVLSDSHPVTPESLEVAFFNLNERPGLPRAEDVVALFELAWKARSKPIFANVKYHPETKTIMLRATPEEVGFARRAFATLTGRPLVEPTVSANPFDGITETLQKIAELLEKQKDK